MLRVAVLGEVARGGAAPFQALVDSAGLVSPFAAGALEGVVKEAEAVLAA
jgi:hypothetical protein